MALIWASYPLVDTLRHPKRALIVDIPVQMDDGTIRHFGCRVQHEKPLRGRMSGVRTILTLISMK